MRVLRFNHLLMILFFVRTSGICEHLSSVAEYLLEFPAFQGMHYHNYFSPKRAKMPVFRDGCIFILFIFFLHSPSELWTMLEDRIFFFKFFFVRLQVYDTKNKQFF